MSADGELPGMWEESDLSGGWADTDGMSARERLIRSVYQKLSQNQMEKLVDAFAHELAEQQRKHWTPRSAGKSADYVQGLDDGFDAAADLIDPAKESDRG